MHRPEFVTVDCREPRKAHVVTKKPRRSQAGRNGGAGTEKRPICLRTKIMNNNESYRPDRAAGQLLIYSMISAGRHLSRLLSQIGPRFGVVVEKPHSGERLHRLSVAVRSVRLAEVLAGGIIKVSDRVAIGNEKRNERAATVR